MIWHVLPETYDPSGQIVCACAEATKQAVNATTNMDMPNFIFPSDLVIGELRSLTRRAAYGFIGSTWAPHDRGGALAYFAAAANVRFSPKRSFVRGPPNVRFAPIADI